MGTPKPLLEINALAPERKVVSIKSPLHPEGKLYELRTPGELTLKQLQTIETRAEQASKVDTDKENTDEELELLERWLDELLDIALFTPVEDEVRQHLGLMGKEAIVSAFNEASLTPAILEATQAAATTATRAAARTTRKRKATGASSSGG
jgi:hypothetical protein